MLCGIPYQGIPLATVSLQCRKKHGSLPLCTGLGSISPYTNDNTYRKDDVYAKAANALYAKMQKVLVFKEVPSLETTFTATASEADGYLVLYRLLQFGHPSFQSQSDEVIKPTLKSRNIFHICDELKILGIVSGNDSKQTKRRISF